MTETYIIFDTNTGETLARGLSHDDARTIVINETSRNVDYAREGN